VENRRGRGRGEPGFSNGKNVEGLVNEKVSKEGRFVQGGGDRGCGSGVKMSEVEGRLGARIQVDVTREK